MVYSKSFIFIKEDLMLIVKLTETEYETSCFIKGICENLCGEGAISQPIEITERIKINIIRFLEHRYSSNVRVNKLINFFRKVEDNNYIYFYHYNEGIKNYFCLLKESLIYYNKRYSLEVINDRMEKSLLEFQKMENILSKHPYKVTPIIPERKIIVGESDKRKRKCIYCGLTQQVGGDCYKEIAHAIPESLGNKKLFQNEECDCCNKYFSNNMEEDFCNMLMFDRLKYGLKSKKGNPEFKLDTNDFVKYFDWEKENYGKDWKKFEAAKGIVKRNQIKGPIIIGSRKGNIQKQCTISGTRGYIPMHVYKTMVKCVVGLIGNEKLDVFKGTIKWLRYDNYYHILPKVAIKENRDIVFEPELYVYERKNESNFALPYCYGELRILSQVYIFIIPFCGKDKRKFNRENQNIEFIKLLNEVYGNYELHDFSDTQLRKVEIQVARIKELIL